MSDESFNQYWTGRDLDYSSMWLALEEGVDYIEKFKNSKIYLLSLSFDNSPYFPLFNHEAIFKTVKGLFHDLKKLNFSSSDYNTYGPIYLYEIRRGSAEWRWVAELRPLLLLWKVLREFADSIKSGREAVKSEWEVAKIKNEILITHPDAADEDKRALINAKTTPQINEALVHLHKQGLIDVSVSEKPFMGLLPSKDS